MLPRRILDMVYRVNSSARDPGAGVHAAAVHSYVQAAGSHAQASAVQPEIEANARGETDGAAEPEGHRQWPRVSGQRRPRVDRMEQDGTLTRAATVRERSELAPAAGVTGHFSLTREKESQARDQSEDLWRCRRI